MIPNLLFITGGFDATAIVEQLERAATAQHENSDVSSFRELFLSGIHIDLPVLFAIERLLNIKKKTLPLEGVHFALCSGLVDRCLQALCSSGVRKLSLLCEFHPLAKSWCIALGRGLQRRDCQIRKLVLQTQMSVDLAYALYEGMAAQHRGHENGQTLEDLSLQLSGACWQSTVLLSAGLCHCKSLRRLSLNRHDSSYILDDQQLEILLKSLRNHPSLKELCIQGSLCPRAGISVISNHLLSVGLDSRCRLEKLDLSNRRFGTLDRLLGMEDLAVALAKDSSLFSLSLSRHCIVETDMKMLTGALVSPCCRLKELCFSGCHLSERCINLLAAKIPYMRSLRTLWLHENPLNEKSAVLQSFLQSVKQNVEIEKLVLPFGRGGDHILEEMDFWLFLNQKGRRLLHSTREGVPTYLWIVLLERITLSSAKDMISWRLVGTPCNDAIPHENPSDGSPSYRIDTKAKELQLSAIFYFLRNSPILFDR
jgi:hypothetical protein